MRVAEPPPATPAPAEIAQPVICVVDDDRDLLAALGFSLEIDGFAVRAFGSGEELLSIEGAAAPAACLVIDQILPGMTGLDLLETLRRGGLASPAILITTHPGVRVRTRAAQLRARIVEKPLLGDSLVRAVREQIAERA